MGDLGSIVNALKGNQTLQNLQAGGYQQVGATAPAPALNMGAYGPINAAQAQNTNINMGQANQFLGGQQSLVNQLQAQANGSGPSLAQAQLRQGTESNLSAQLAAAASQRGNQNPGAQQYALGNQAAAANQQAAGQAASLRAQEQLSAQSGLGQALGSYGGQQIGLAENQAGLNQQTSLANLNAIQGVNLANMGAQNATNEFNVGSAQQGNAAQQAQYQFGQNLAAQSQNQLNQILGGMATNSANSANTFLGGAVGGGLNALGSAAAGYGSGASNPASNVGTSDGGAATTSSNQGGSGGSGDFSGNYNASAAPDGSSFDAVGGAFYKPGPGVPLRVGEKGPEAVVPLDGSQGDPHAFLDQMMKKLAMGQPGKAQDHSQAIGALMQLIAGHQAEIDKLKKKKGRG